MCKIPILAKNSHAGIYHHLPVATIRLTSYSWNGPIVLHVAFPSNEWKRAEKSNKGPLSELWYTTSSHTPPTNTTTNTKTHTDTLPGTDGTRCLNPYDLMKQMVRISPKNKLSLKSEFVKSFNNQLGRNEFRRKAKGTVSGLLKVMRVHPLGTVKIS